MIFGTFQQKTNLNKYLFQCRHGFQIRIIGLMFYYYKN
jgi:hypothetical protein